MSDILCIYYSRTGNTRRAVKEIAEALEADRKNKRADLSAFFDKEPCEIFPFREKFEVHVKDTFEDELADATIRLLDLSTALGIDLEMHVLLKMQYNEGRGYKHGKRY